MSKYTISDVREADRLYDQMSLRKVAEETDIPEGTLRGWSTKGLISTETNHYRNSHLKANAKTIQRADDLYDLMPLPQIAEILDVTHTQLKSWSRSNLITTGVDWARKNSGDKKKANPHRAVELVHDKGMKKKDAAKELGVAQSTITRYLKQYRNGNL